MGKPIVVQSLIGGSQLSFYINCLKSLIEFSADTFELYLHNDCSLSKGDEEFVYSELSGTDVTISDSSKSTNRTLDLLEGKPNSQKFRKESIWGIEFFDPLFSNVNDPISFYLDADIFFLRSFSGLFSRSHTEGGAVFLKDTQWDAYCIRPWHLVGAGKKPDLVKGITTGLVFWDKRAIDWDYLEWFLGTQEFHNIPDWIMPTAQAGLAKRCQSKTVCPKQITNLYPNAKLSEDTFGIHLFGSYRKEWFKKIDVLQKNRAKDLPVCSARFDICKKLGFSGYAWNQAKRWCNTRLNIW